MRKYIILTLLIFNCCLGFAVTYYSDPVNGLMSNSGSISDPWANLESIFNTSPTFAAGDTIICLSGNHGFPKINGVNSNYVTIKAAAGNSPSCTRIYFGSTTAASYWRIDGLSIISENTAPNPQRLIDILDINCDHISIINCTISSNHTTTGWTRNDWRTKAATGIWARGNNHIVKNNSIKNVAIGIIVDAPGTICNTNVIQNFTIDGVRGNANDCQYNENVIMDNIVVYTYAENHYDGFQSFTNSSIDNVQFRKNTIIACTDTTRDFRGSMQGMGCFDGFYNNWVIENNLIVTDHWHGITLLGAMNCKIINNTVIDVYDVTPIIPWDTASISSYGPTWIKIADHKNGSPSQGNSVINNLCDDMQNTPGIGNVASNLVLNSSSNHSLHFVDALNLDFHIIASSSAIDSGTSTFAPTTDIEGSIRPSGMGFDIGAFEFQGNVGLYDVNPSHNNLKVYPNPTNDYINVAIREYKQPQVYQLKILNALGQIVFETSIKQAEFQINTNSFGGCGTYYITIFDNQEVLIDTRKFILE